MASTVSSSTLDDFKSKYRESATTVERELCDKRQVEASDDIYTPSLRPSSPPPSLIHQNSTARIVADIDTYYAYGEMLAKCGRLQESFEVYAHACRLQHESVPLEKLTCLVHALVDNLKRFVSWIKSCDHGPHATNTSSSDHYGDCIDQLLCPICEDILKYPVTSVCGHTFCRQCCFGRTQCSICCENFQNTSPLIVPSNSSISLLTFAENSSHSCSNHTLHKYSNNFSDSSSTIAMPSSSASVSSSASSVYYLEQDVLVRRLVEKWWAPQLQAAELNDNAQRCLDNGFLDEALKNCNQSLMLGKLLYLYISRKNKT